MAYLIFLLFLLFSDTHQPIPHQLTPVLLTSSGTMSAQRISNKLPDSSLQSPAPSQKEKLSTKELHEIASQKSKITWTSFRSLKLNPDKEIDLSNIMKFVRIYLNPPPRIIEHEGDYHDWQEIIDDSPKRITQLLRNFHSLGLSPDNEAHQPYIMAILRLCIQKSLPATLEIFPKINFDATNSLHQNLIIQFLEMCMQHDCEITVKYLGHFESILDRLSQHDSKNSQWDTNTTKKWVSIFLYLYNNNQRDKIYTHLAYLKTMDQETKFDCARLCVSYNPKPVLQYFPEFGLTGTKRGKIIQLCIQKNIQTTWKYFRYLQVDPNEEMDRKSIMKFVRIYLNPPPRIIEHEGDYRDWQEIIDDTPRRITQLLRNFHSLGLSPDNETHQQYILEILTSCIQKSLRTTFKNFSYAGLPIELLYRAQGENTDAEVRTLLFAEKSTRCNAILDSERIAVLKFIKTNKANPEIMHKLLKSNDIIVILSVLHKIRQLNGKISEEILSSIFVQHTFFIDFIIQEFNIKTDTLKRLAANKNTHEIKHLLMSIIQKNQKKQSLQIIVMLIKKCIFRIQLWIKKTHEVGLFNTVKALAKKIKKIVYIKKSNGSKEILETVWNDYKRKEVLKISQQEFLRRKALLQKIAKELSQEFGQHFLGIIIVGSMDKGYVIPESDVDFVILGDTLELLNAIKMKLCKEGLDPCSGVSRLLHTQDFKINQEKKLKWAEMKDYIGLDILFRGVFFGDEKRLIKIRKAILSSASQDEWDKIVLLHLKNEYISLHKYFERFRFTAPWEQNLIKAYRLLYRLPAHYDTLKAILQKNGDQWSILSEKSLVLEQCKQLQKAA